MDISSKEKLEHELGKDLGYSVGNESDKLLDSCTNILKTKHFNFGMVKISSLGPCDFGSVVDDVDMDLTPSVLLESPLCSVTSVKERLCFEPTKFFALNIGLLAIPRNTLCDKLKDVRKLFYKVDGFGGALTPSKFPGIVRMFFTSVSSLALAKQLAVSENLVVNTDLKKISIRLDQEIVIKKILVDLPKSAIELVLVKYEKIFSIKMQLIGLWQKALAEFENSQVADLVASKWSILLGKNLARVAKANADKQTWDLKNSYHTLLYTLLIGTTAHDFSNLVQSYDKRRLVLIYAKKQAPMSHPVSFGGATWTSVVNSSPKNLSSIPFVETDISIRLVSGSMPEVAILALCVSVLKHLFENVSNQIANILHKLNRLLAVSSVSFVVSPTPKHKPVLDIAVDTLLFVFSVPSVITIIAHDISPSGS
ncbi:hypothetical protein G9A89_007781 [Geosiphon pyriformis]|nr:hypothetical protein G9A89_007781 [Geosiphon pyriformis]